MNQHLNLVPRAVRRRQLIAQRLRYWLPVWGAALVLGGSLFNTQRRSLIEARNVTAALDSQCQEIRQLATDSENTRREIRELNQRALWLRSLEQSGLLLLTLAAVSQSTGSLAGEVQLDRIQFQALDVTPIPPPTAQPKDNVSMPPTAVGVDDRLELTGTATDDAVVTSLLTRLEFTGLFAEVELVALQAHGEDGRQFQIRCVLRATARQAAALADLPGQKTTVSEAAKSELMNRTR